MTVSQNDLLVGPVTPANGVTVISLDFPVEDASYLEVFKSGSETPLVLSTDYTVQNAGTETDGQITLTTAADGSTAYSIYFIQPLQRTSDFQFRGNFKSEPFNKELDRVWRAIQSVNTKIDRSLRLGSTSAIAPISIFAATGNENRVLAFNSDGTQIGIGPTISEIENAQSNATTATTKASEAANSATSASNSAAAASTSATNAANSENAAATSATAASSSATNSSTSASAASASATAAAASAAAVAALGASADLGDLTGTVLFDEDDGQNQRGTLIGDVNFTVNATSFNDYFYHSFQLRLTQDATGGRSITFSSDFDFGVYGTPRLDNSAGKTHVFSLQRISDSAKVEIQHINTFG